jgi:hypothetical protein
MADIHGIRIDLEMWTVFRGDPLSLQLECLDEAEDAVDLTDYSTGVNLVWGDDDDERLELDDLEVIDAEGSIVASVTADEVEDLPLGKKTRVYLVLTPPDEDQYTTLLGRVTVRDA